LICGGWRRDDEEEDGGEGEEGDAIGGQRVRVQVCQAVANAIEFVCMELEKYQAMK